MFSYIHIYTTCLVTYLCTDIMPGEHDPANLSLPQQPFNACLLPLSNHLSTCHFVSNPYEAEISGRVSFSLLLLNIDIKRETKEREHLFTTDISGDIRTASCECNEIYGSREPTGTNGEHDLLAPHRPDRP